MTGLEVGGVSELSMALGFFGEKLLDCGEVFRFVVAHALHHRAEVEVVLEFHALGHLEQALGEAQGFGRLGGEARGVLQDARQQFFGLDDFEHHAHFECFGGVDDAAR